VKKAGCNDDLESGSQSDGHRGHFPPRAAEPSGRGGAGRVKLRLRKSEPDWHNASRYTSE